jgi:hypothetical protein
MFANTIAITYNAVSKTLVRSEQVGRTSEYYLNDGLTRFYLRFSHTVPSNGGGGESHMVRLDVETYDGTTGLLKRTDSAWTVIKTFNAAQDDTGAENVAKALVAFTTNANITSLVDREY